MRSAYDLETPINLDWRQQAACSPQTAQWWDVDTGKVTQDNLRALFICRTRCPVRARCDAWEQAHPSPWSRIAGGRVWSSMRTAGRGRAVTGYAVDVSGLDGLP